VRVETKNGRIVIKAGPEAGGAVSIIADIKAGGKTQEEADERLRLTKLYLERLDDQTLYVHVDWPEPRRNHDGCNLEIILPEANGVLARTGNGAISVSGATGKADLDTSNGAVTLSQHGGDATIHTSNGRVTCVEVAGRCSVSTSNGKIELRDMGDTVVAVTSNGAVSLDLQEGAGSDFEISTSNGAIHATVPSEWAGRIDASTSNGSIDILGTARIEKHSKRHVTLHLGEDGRVTSSLRTSNGRITVDVKD
jgi:putative adhesin